jgi:hypothetical protein
MVIRLGRVLERRVGLSTSSPRHAMGAKLGEQPLTTTFSSG